MYLDVDSGPIFVTLHMNVSGKAENAQFHLPTDPIIILQHIYMHNKRSKW